MNMTIEVDFLAGTNIKSAIKEAKQLASILGVAFVQFKFNETEFSVSHKADIKKMIKEYKNQKTEYGIVD